MISTWAYQYWPRRSRGQYRMLRSISHHVQWLHSQQLFYFIFFKNICATGHLCFPTQCLIVVTNNVHCLERQRCKDMVPSNVELSGVSASFILIVIFVHGMLPTNSELLLNNSRTRADLFRFEHTINNENAFEVFSFFELSAIALKKSRQKLDCFAHLYMYL